MIEKIFPKSKTPDKTSPKPKKAQKSQEELRKALEARFLGMKGIARGAMEEFERVLKEKAFEDKASELEGDGTKRREVMQAKLDALLNRAEQMKAKLSSKKELPNYTDSISVAYTHPDKKVENITFSIEEKLEESITLYKKIKLDLPPDFEDQVKEIWENNLDAIQKAIEENGFDEILIIPGISDVGDLSEKMKMENGYYDYIKSNSNVKNLSGIPLASTNADKSRLVLVHRTQNLKDRPELQKTLNVEGQDVKQDQALTLEDYIVFQRKYFEETTKHLDVEGWTWLVTKSGSRLVFAGWLPGAGRLGVSADDLGYRDASLGARPSRSFF